MTGVPHRRLVPDDIASIESSDIVRTAEISQCSFVIVTGAQRSGSEPLWRALAILRSASVGYAALRFAVIERAEYSRPDWAWAVIAIMSAWTAGTAIAYARPDRRTRLLPGAGLAVTIGLLSTTVLQYPNATVHGALPVTATRLNSAARRPSGRSTVSQSRE